MANVELSEFSLERMVRAVEKVRDRLVRAAAALEQAGIPYAVTGGNAVAAWVSRVDEAAVRNTQDVDLLVRRGDIARVSAALESAGFIHRHAAGIDMFLDGPNAKARDAVHVLFAGEKVRPEYAYPATDVEPADQANGYRIVALESLVRMKLTSFRRKDQVHLIDMLDVGLIDATWLPKLPADLAARLQELIDTPDG
ncbi:MAG: nucleotidyltransferase family protein [Planctomycetia bacterium]|nr:nucleotidyltransferase family protein [Planctomycetia bacterium]